MDVILRKSDKKDKKYKVTIGNKTIHFGSAGSSDYTIHKDLSRKNLYIKRHQAREDWNNPLTAGFWSRWLLWNETDINKSIKDIEKRFNLNIKI